ncbi:hypothetical protein MEO40_14615 [Dolichospermum sp. ST_sed1]|jgi:hypothetical protein|nr:hypothetical protein [Dolichospermum sp. ST_sed1]MDD1426010.1 hypothetical protein [Dolichospermum sp. ST_sed9]MDD1432137.1 hypothetical protein [Dolichospermum sp. ST_sed6]MDD1436190.1 hypothetical protein [Dolichospermum sp. ST_sed10]MDD1441088.1 hypothetical protein [Dolichospermum sp. ST_sed3]MDD1447939.1 hypothetical protein [Dolichospermum sp. ST_sed8]MDD1455968.1 hypothetical protein [Dolichospermum sp. ST_sed7]MDD1461444.1 hypothetical protein [Dolichospermum sp. ST_sed2]MDD14667
MTFAIRLGINSQLGCRFYLKLTPMGIGEELISCRLSPQSLLYSYQRMMKKEKARSSVDTADIRGKAGSRDLWTS